MPSCRACHRAQLGGPHQEQQQLVKYRKGSKPKLVVNLPGYVGTFDQRFIHQHLPNLFHGARNAGDRVVRPHQYFEQDFEQPEDPVFYSYALNWIFTRVEFFSRNPYWQGATFQLMDPENVLQQLWLRAEANDAMGDRQAALEDLRLATELFEIIGKILRSDRGLNYSDKLLREYIHTMTIFLAYLSTYHPRLTFRAIKAAYQLCGRDPGIVDRLTQNLGPVERQQAYQEAMIEWQRGNNQVAWEVAEAIR